MVWAVISTRFNPDTNGTYFCGKAAYNVALWPQCHSEPHFDGRNIREIRNHDVPIDQSGNVEGNTPMRKGMIVSVAAMGLTLPVFAQQPAGAPPRALDRPDLTTERVREVDDLSLVLGLRETQRPALSAFLQASRPPAPPAAPSRSSMRAVPAESFEAELDWMADQDARHSAEARRRIDAGHVFYDQLDDHQRKVFDAVMRLRHGPRGGHGAAGPEFGGPGKPRDYRPDGTPIAGALPHE
ncbi:Spy/CpxP family protein refolding chaperone [Sphingomonas sp. NPDC079357]|uniref:Spy/CpxP family protein refolding chaperone n=1 Tax=Sphingomonas sp. NPDC079357 TaxID=3364518 RepID=UPI00384BD1AD